MPPVAAADAGKASHTTSSSAHSSPVMKSSNESSNGTMLCHIVKRPDFDGYGFNLHSEKSRPGQFIGKIDANSPAEAAGLKEGDRIIEVNGLPIGTETHKQVVQRIKAIAWEVKLLVVREMANSNSNANDNNNQSANKSNNSTKENNVKHEQSSNGASNDTISVINSNNAISSMKNNGNSVSPMTTTSPHPYTPPPPSKTMADENSPTGSSIQKPGADGTLKLPSTAAEMRAILQSKKKYNPKSEDVNLQKKYDIIQKL